MKRRHDHIKNLSRKGLLKKPVFTIEPVQASTLTLKLSQRIMECLEFRDYLSMKMTCHEIYDHPEPNHRSMEASHIRLLYKLVDGNRYRKRATEYYDYTDVHNATLGCYRVFAKAYKYWYHVIPIEFQDAEMYLEALCRWNFIDCVEDVMDMHTACWTNDVLVAAVRAFPAIITVEKETMPTITDLCYRIAGYEDPTMLREIPRDVYRRNPVWTDSLVSNEARWAISDGSLAMFPPDCLTDEQIETAYNNGIRMYGAMNHNLSVTFVRNVLAYKPNLIVHFSSSVLTEEMIMDAFENGMNERDAIKLLNRIDCETLAVALVKREPASLRFMDTATITEKVIYTAFTEDRCLRTRIRCQMYPPTMVFMPQVINPHLRHLMRRLRRRKV